MNIELPIMLTVALFLALGIFSQWIANMIKWPAIVVMAIVGLLIGPIFGFVNPQESLGSETFSSIVSLAVAVILFEGSSNLDFRELSGISKALIRIITIGSIVSWLLGSLALHFILDFPFEIASILSGLFLISGPTVIQPLLKQAKVKKSVDILLRWESIILDPIGPIVALAAFFVVYIIEEGLGAPVILTFILKLISIIVIGFIAALLFRWLNQNNKISQNLVVPIQFVFILLTFSISDLILSESGLLSVTLFGLCMAVLKRGDFIYSESDRFVKHTSVILISAVFILITSSLTPEVLKHTFNWKLILFCIVMILLVRPISIFFSTINTEVSLKERAFLSSVMPRGIVVLTVAEFFSGLLVDEKIPMANLVTPITFGFVFITVVIYGFSFKTLAKKFGMSSNEPPGVILVGESLFSNHLGTMLKQHHIPVMSYPLRKSEKSEAKELEFETFDGNLLSNNDRIYQDLTRYDYSLLLTPSFVLNVFAFNELTPEFGLKNVHMIDDEHENREKEHRVESQITNHILFEKRVSFRDLNEYIKEHTIIEINANEQEQITENDLVLYHINEKSEITFKTVRTEILGKEKGVYGVLKGFK